MYQCIKFLCSNFFSKQNTDRTPENLLVQLLE